MADVAQLWGILQQDVSRRLAEIENRQLELDERAVELSGQEASLARHAAQVVRREQELTALQAELSSTVEALQALEKSLREGLLQQAEAAREQLAATLTEAHAAALPAQLLPPPQQRQQQHQKDQGSTVAHFRAAGHQLPLDATHQERGEQPVQQQLAAADRVGADARSSPGPLAASRRHAELPLPAQQQQHEEEEEQQQQQHWPGNRSVDQQPLLPKWEPPLASPPRSVEAPAPTVPRHIAGYGHRPGQLAAPDHSGHRRQHHQKQQDVQQSVDKDKMHSAQRGGPSARWQSRKQQQQGKGLGQAPEHPSKDRQHTQQQQQQQEGGARRHVGQAQKQLQRQHQRAARPSHQQHKRHRDEHRNDRPAPGSRQDRQKGAQNIGEHSKGKERRAEKWEGATCEDGRQHQQQHTGVLGPPRHQQRQYTTPPAQQQQRQQQPDRHGCHAEHGSKRSRQGPYPIQGSGPRGGHSNIDSSGEEDDDGRGLHSAVQLLRQEVAAAAAAQQGPGGGTGVPEAGQRQQQGQQLQGQEGVEQAAAQAQRRRAEEALGRRREEALARLQAKQVPLAGGGPARGDVPGQLHQAGLEAGLGQQLL